MKLDFGKPEEGFFIEEVGNNEVDALNKLNKLSEKFLSTRYNAEQSVSELSKRVYHIGVMNKDNESISIKLSDCFERLKGIFESYDVNMVSQGIAGIALLEGYDIKCLIDMKMYRELTSIVRHISLDTRTLNYMIESLPDPKKDRVWGENGLQDLMKYVQSLRIVSSEDNNIDYYKHRDLEYYLGTLDYFISGEVYIFTDIMERNDNCIQKELDRAKNNGLREVADILANLEGFSERTKITSYIQAYNYAREKLAGVWLNTGNLEECNAREELIFRLMKLSKDVRLIKKSELLDEDVINITLKRHIKDSDTMVSFIKNLTIANQADLDAVKDAVRSFMYKTKADGNDENKEFLNNFLMNGEVVNLTYTDMGLVYYKKYKPIPTEIDRFLEIIKNNKNPLKYLY